MCTVCVRVCVCKPSPPVTYGHMVQSWPILGRQGGEESWSVEGARCVVLHPLLAADKCHLPLQTDLTLAHQAQLGMSGLSTANGANKDCPIEVS